MTFTLNFGPSSYSYSYTCFSYAPIYLSSAVRIIRDTYGSSKVVATILVKVFCCLIESWIGCSKLILEKYYDRAKFRQTDTQSNFIQQSRINFAELWVNSGNSVKFNLHLGKITCYTVLTSLFLSPSRFYSKSPTPCPHPDFNYLMILLV